MPLIVGLQTGQHEVELLVRHSRRKRTGADGRIGRRQRLVFDVKRPVGAAREWMSPRAFGHVGFTGTSLWIDPMRDRYFVLLTNRACQGGTLDEMRDLSAQGLGRRSVGWMLNALVAGHLNNMAGELSCLKGLQGFKGYPF